MASFTLHGIPVTRGIAIGRAHLLAPAALDVKHCLVAADQVEAEVQRLQSAITTVHKDLQAIWKELPSDAPAELGAFIDVHALILSDPIISDMSLNIIRSRHYNAEWALVTQIDELSAQFEEIEDAYLRARKHDIQQVGDRAFGGFITDLGGQNSHTAIVARSLDIPAAVGMHHASTLIVQDDWLIIDGDAGVVIVDPTPGVLAQYRERQARLVRERKKLSKLRKMPAVTRDGTKITLLANIELPEDCGVVMEAGAAGFGLLRSELLFMGRTGAGKRLPSEDEQFESYRKAVTAMKGRPVTIRTLDIGADKPLDAAEETALNPALGLRAIRYCLAEPQMFLTQLRAILRASAYGPVKLLIPMLSHAFEIDQTMGLLEQAKAQLREANKKFDPLVPVGAMIEIPAAALTLPMFVKRMDFLSVGTNDLIQYTLAIDRVDHEVAHLYDPLHPAVLFLLSNIIAIGAKAGVPVSVCGELAGDAKLTRLLRGMGLREFSMHPGHLLTGKQEMLISVLTVRVPL